MTRQRWLVLVIIQRNPRPGPSDPIRRSAFSNTGSLLRCTATAAPMCSLDGRFLHWPLAGESYAAIYMLTDSGRQVLVLALCPPHDLRNAAYY